MFPITLPRESPLVEGVLVRRHKRFLADVELSLGGLVTAHCVNTGAMEGLTNPGTRVWLSRASNPKRLLQWTWEMAEIDGQLIGTNTSLPNRVVKSLLEMRALPWLKACKTFKPEQRYGANSRVDFLIEMPDHILYLEVKNNHLVYPDRRAYFPDSVSERGTHHLLELARQIRPGVRAEVLFFCQLPGVKAVRPSDVHDPEFARTARETAKAGLRFSAICLRQDPECLIVEGKVPVDLKPYPVERAQRWKNENKARLKDATSSR
jgi:sugar fermentation stimulation protein A